MREPSAIALATWRCSRNHANHWGKSVKTSISTGSLPEEGEVDVDAPPGDVDGADGVVHERDEQVAAAAGAGDLEHLAGRQLEHAPDLPDDALAVGDRAALELVRPVGAVVE